MTTREARAAIEAVIMAAVEPVPPAVLAQLVELPAARDRGDLRQRSSASTSARAAGSRSDASPAATATRPTSTRTRTSSGSCSKARPRASRARARDARDRRLQATDRTAQLSAIRGVNVDATLKTLVARGYVEEVGHEPTPGNPVLFGTTSMFLERLGLDSLDQLPALGDFVPDASVVEALERGLRLPGESVPPAIDEDESPEDEVAAELQSGLGEA